MTRSTILLTYSSEMRYADAHLSAYRPAVVAGDETATMLGSLERQRATLAWKCGGLDSGDLRATAWGLRGTRWTGTPIATGEWHSAAEDTPEQLMALWRDAVARSRSAVTEALAAGGLYRPARRSWPDGRAPSLRRILIDIIEEYARHVGHADLLRESVDGLVGEDPPR
jgi:hypothetical protein